VKKSKKSAKPKKTTESLVPRNRRVRIDIAKPESGTRIMIPANLFDATQKVVMDGDAITALKGLRGYSIGCALSQVAGGSLDCFPHLVDLVVFLPTVAYAVWNTHTDEGYNAVRYRHNYRHMVKANDEGTLKSLLADNPELMIGITLFPVKEKSTSHHDNSEPIEAARKELEKNPHRSNEVIAIAARVGTTTVYKARKLNKHLDSDRRVNKNGREYVRLSKQVGRNYALKGALLRAKQAGIVAPGFRVDK
jgi:hypothetical protein